MASRDVPKGHCWADRCAGARVRASHHTRSIVANRIEACDRSAVAINHLRAGISLDASERAQFARNDAHGVERWSIEWGNARVGLVAGCAVEALVGVRAALELGVLAPPRGAVELADCAFKPGRIDPAGLGKSSHSIAALDVSRSQEGPHRNGRGAQRAETEAADCVMVAHDPRFRLLVVAAGFDQGRYKHVIRYRLVDEAA